MDRVLFITYFWPPSGKASLHWPLYIIKHLPDFGWQPAVLTVDKDSFSHSDESLLHDVSPDLTVVRTRANEPFDIYRRFLGKKPDAPLVASEAISKENRDIRHRISVWIRMNLFVPDARIGWYLSAVGGGKKLLGKEKFDAIVSIGPPHSVHLIGRTLGKKTGLPHIPVFIDPWVDIVYYRGFKRNPMALALDRHFEKSVLQNAALSVFVTRSMMDDYVHKYPWLGEKSRVLYWGYNEESFVGFGSGRRTGDSRVILHAGNIFDYQNPEPLWRNVAAKVSAGERIRLKFVGTVGPKIMKSIEEHGLSPFTEYLGFLEYEGMIRQLEAADYLLVCATEKRHVPGKLFEYMRSGRRIIAFGDDNEEVAAMLREGKSGSLFPYDYPGGDILEKVDECRPDIDASKKYSRQRIAQELSRLLLDASSSS